MAIAYLIIEILANFTKNDFWWYCLTFFQVCLFLMMLPLWKDYKKAIITIIIYNLYIIATSYFFEYVNPVQTSIEVIIFGLIIVYNEEKDYDGYYFI